MQLYDHERSIIVKTIGGVEETNDKPIINALKTNVKQSSCCCF